MEYLISIYRSDGSFLYDREREDLKGAVKVAIAESLGGGIALIIEIDGEGSKYKGVFVNGWNLAIARSIARKE